MRASAPDSEQFSKSQTIFTMKIRLHIFAPLAVLCAALMPARAQTDSASRTVNEVFKIDEHGDAAVEVTFQYNATKWAKWKEEYANHPDIVLRDMRYTMAAAVIEDFSLEKDDVQRKALGKIKARALARYRNGGEFVVEIPKALTLVTGADKDWIFSSTSGRNGEIVSTTERLKLPAGANDVHLSPGGDFNNLIYTIDVSPARPKGWMFAGVAMLCTGVVLLVISLFTKSKKASVLAPDSGIPVQRPPSLPPQ
jgi:hypothetical protein